MHHTHMCKCPHMCSHSHTHTHLPQPQGNHIQLVRPSVPRGAPQKYTRTRTHAHTHTHTHTHLPQLQGNHIQLVTGLTGLVCLEELHVSGQHLPPGQSLQFDPVCMQTLAPTLRVLAATNCGLQVLIMPSSWQGWGPGFCLPALRTRCSGPWTRVGVLAFGAAVVRKHTPTPSPPPSLHTHTHTRAPPFPLTGGVPRAPGGPV